MALLVEGSQYLSMGIFPDAQGQLTQQSEVRSGRILNTCEMLWLSSLPSRIKKIHSPIKREGARVVTILYMYTPYSVMGSGSSNQK